MVPPSVKSRDFGCFNQDCQTTLDISSNSDSTTTMRNLFQWWLILVVQNFFLTSKWNFSWATHLHCASLYCTSCTKHHWNTWKLWLDCPQPSLPKVKKIQFLQPFFFSSIFSKYFGYLLLNLLWNWGRKDGTQYSRCGLTRAWKRIMENLLICFLGSCWHSPRQSLPSLYEGFQLHTCSDGDSCGLEAIRKEFMGVYLGFTDN